MQDSSDTNRSLPAGIARAEAEALQRVADEHGWNVRRIETRLWPQPGYELRSADGEIVLLCPSAREALAALFDELGLTARDPECS